MKYKIKEQHPTNERTFLLVDKDGDTFWVDIYSDGELEAPEHHNVEEFEKWLKTFIGKEIEIEKLSPYIYFSSGKTILISK